MTPYLYRWQEISIGTYLADDWEEQDHGEPPEIERRWGGGSACGRGISRVSGGCRGGCGMAVV
jgi:hypothetical protein